MLMLVLLLPQLDFALSVPSCNNGAIRPDRHARHLVFVPSFTKLHHLFPCPWMVPGKKEGKGGKGGKGGRCEEKRV